MSLHPDTAHGDRSIWKDFARNKFESYVQTLSKKQHVAGRQSYAGHSHPGCDNSYPIPFEIERSLADDFAFIAASQPTVEYVTGVAVEQKVDNPSLLIRLAANEGVSPEVARMFDRIFEVLKNHARREITRDFCQEQVFELLVQLNCNRILGRLGSTWFQRPMHLPKTRESLPTCLRRLLRSNVRTDSQRCNLLDLEELDLQIASFEAAFKQLDKGKSDEVLCNVKHVIKRAFQLTENGVKLPQRLRALGCPDAHLDARDVREVGKVSNYWRISRYLTIWSARYRSHFANAEWSSLPSYKPSIASRVQAQQFVHAEIQLLVYYELSPPDLIPRVIGVSKEACFLCDSFVRAHGQFRITGAHRQTFAQWTIPDLEGFNLSTIQRFRLALSRLFLDVQAEYVRSQKKLPWRPFPLQSAINLNLIQLSTPSTSSIIPQTKSQMSQDSSILEIADSYVESMPSQIAQKSKNTKYNKEDDYQGDDSQSTLHVHKHQSSGNLIQRSRHMARPIFVHSAAMAHTDWLRIFASFSSLQAPIKPELPRQDFTQGRITLKPALEATGLCNKISLADMSEGEELVLRRESNDPPNELSFVLVGPRGKEVIVCCQWRQLPQHDFTAMDL